MDFEEDPDEMPAKVAPKKPGGTFQSMGLSRPILKAIERKGYKLATPIQRKCIPPIMTGRDLVAMARTGSGKSAAFLLPLIDKLKIRQPKSEIRALVLSPTRELATQTFKFVREFTKYTNLIPKLIIGGESISKDFETVTSRPDILVATPGRLAHVLVEMKQKLSNVEIVVFDEADRLFEPGFKEMEQVNEICRRLPDSKQTLLFSATMPQKLADFAKVGLRNPLFIRLDVESNLSETLKTIHLHCNHHDKFAILVYLLKKFVDKEEMTVVFMPTKHHIEYAKMLLENTSIDCCHVYSSMDPEARKINIDRFTKKICRVMLVTDIAARGIDIPLLDIVINYNFPFKPKLFVHRVGRVARAGRFGCAISLVSHDETPYLHALYIFLGLPLTVASEAGTLSVQSKELKDLPDNILGSVPQSILDDENEILKRWHEHNEDLKAMVKVCDNAMKPYLKAREPSTPFSVNSAKDIHKKAIGSHPIFQGDGRDTEEMDMLNRIKAYRPKTIQKVRQENEQESKNFQDSKFYLKYQPPDHAKEKGLELDKATLDLVGDDEEQLKGQKVWDRKRKKYVQPESNNKCKKIKTESGAYISASYQSGLFDKWKSQSKFNQKASDDEGEVGEKGKISFDKLRAKLQPSRKRKELKNPEEILKERNIREKREAIMRLRTQKKAQRKNQRGGGAGSGGKGKFSDGKGRKGGKISSDGKRGKVPGGKRSSGGKAKSSGKQQATPHKTKGYKPPRVDGGKVRRRR